MLWGFSIESLDWWGVVFMISGGLLGVLGLIASLVSAYVLYRVADIAQKELVSETRSSAELIAKLNNDTARLTADNLALQTVLLPRRAGLVGLDEEPRAKAWFAGFGHWAGTKALIQVVPGDPEAQNLANEIAIILSKFGWAPEFIDEKRSGESLNMKEGLVVLSPSSYKAWNPNDPVQQMLIRLHEAEGALASALTQAGLGVGDRPVTHGGIIVDFPPDSDAAKAGSGSKFNPQLDGVYLQIGSRPVAATVAWIKQGRPDVLGNKPADAIPAEKPK